MKTITKTIYQFAELNDEAKKKAVKHYLDDLDDYHFLPDDMRYRAEELLKENGLEVAFASGFQVFYSLSHSQGDGAMIEGEFEWKGYGVKVKHKGHYYHERSTSIEIWREEGDVVVDADTKIYTEFEEEVYVRMCAELARYGYDCIDTFRAFDNVADILISNEYWFTDKGVMVDEAGE